MTLELKVRPISKYEQYGFYFSFIATFTVPVNLIGVPLYWNRPVLKLFILDLWPLRETPGVGSEEKVRLNQSKDREHFSNFSTRT